MRLLFDPSTMNVELLACHQFKPIGCGDHDLFIAKPVVASNKYAVLIPLSCKGFHFALHHFVHGFVLVNQRLQLRNFVLQLLCKIFLSEAFKLLLFPCGRVTPNEAQFKDAMRYRKLKFFLDTLVIMDKDKGSLHFTDGTDFDKYIDRLRLGNPPLTIKDITAHAMEVLKNELEMTIKESRK